MTVVSAACCAALQLNLECTDQGPAFKVPVYPPHDQVCTRLQYLLFKSTDVCATQPESDGRWTMAFCIAMYWSAGYSIHSNKQGKRYLIHIFSLQSSSRKQFTETHSGSEAIWPSVYNLVIGQVNISVHLLHLVNNTMIPHLQLQSLL